MAGDKKGKLILLFTIFVSMAIIVFNSVLKGNKDVQYLAASWTYNYENIREITENSDMIALVKVVGRAEENPNDGIPYTIYEAEVINPVFQSQLGESVLIRMTGINNNDNHVEILDDPLFENKQEFLIFTRRNDEGTYTILGGPQGRLVHKKGKLNSLQAVDSRVRDNNANSNINIVDADADKLINEIRGIAENVMSE